MSAYLALEATHALHEVRILLAQLDVALLQQPPWQTTHLPFRTYVWSGTHDDIHSVLLTQAAELSNIVLSAPVEDALLAFVLVPEDVYADGVHAESLAHLDAMLPVGTGNAGIVQFGSLYHEWFAVKKESALASLKGTSICRHE